MSQNKLQELELKIKELEIELLKLKTIPIYIPYIIPQQPYPNYWYSPPHINITSRTSNAISA
jgi:hypothetical protein